MTREPGTGAWLAAVGLAGAVHLALLGGLALLPTGSNAGVPETSISIVAPPSAGFASNLAEIRRVASQATEPVPAARPVSGNALTAVEAAGDKLAPTSPEFTAPPVAASVQPAAEPHAAHVAPAGEPTRQSAANDPATLASPVATAAATRTAPAAAPATLAAHPETVLREAPLRPRATARAEAASSTPLPAAPVEALTPLTRVASRSVPTPTGPSTAARVAPEAPAVMPSRPSRVASTSRGAVTTAAPASPAQRPAAETQVATLVPTRNRTLAQPESVTEYRKALDFLRRYEGGGCFVALPSLRTGSTLGLDGFAADTASLTSFAEEFSRATGVSAAAQLDTVSLAQCRALTFAQNLPSYPAFSLRIDIEQRRLRSGERLRGKVHEVADRTAHLLLVDDEGKVQRADGFLARSGADATFAAHMTLTGGPVATVQLLVALAADERLETVERLDGEDAQLFFAELAEEIAKRGLAVDLAIASFSVQ